MTSLNLPFQFSIIVKAQIRVINSVGAKGVWVLIKKLCFSCTYMGDKKELYFQYRDLWKYICKRCFWDWFIQLHPVYSLMHHWDSEVKYTSSIKSV